MHAVLPRLESQRTTFPPLRRRSVSTLQVNLGYRCNQSCLHCHVAASPHRTEMMDGATVDLVIDTLKHLGASALDLTGGAPELNPYFRALVTEARAHGVKVIDRCNLTVLFESGQETTAQFLADQRVAITASLPCYSVDNVDKQRGDGVFDQSIKALQRLNRLGYGDGSSGLELNLVYNPQGPSLPPSQVKLEADYKHILGENFGIRFDHLFTLANMPIQRFGSTLISKGTFAGYMTLLKDAHRDENLDGVMCRDQLSIDWQGYVYDCDFNQMLGLATRAEGRPRTHLRDLLASPRDALVDGAIVVRDHCYGCTAGQGSSCGGALG
ncbi:MAG: arsenosugar biosynthesis radical SAM protein ArsS [Burkholderiales bacterium]|nr:arsenosugar biosynthesis radical SAM protein ArsS [Burkholderiales bacterium]